MPSKKPQRIYKVGDRVTVSLSSGRVVEATVRAVVKAVDGVRLQGRLRPRRDGALVEMLSTRKTS